MVDPVDVVVPGRPTADVIFSGLDGWPEPGGEIYARDFHVSAGAHFNTAAALARLGLRVAFVAVVGDDAFGELVLRDLRSEGLDDAFVRVESEIPTPVSAVLSDGAERGFVTFGPDHGRAEALAVERTRALLASGRVRHVHADLSAARHLVEAVRAAGSTLSVDAWDAGDWLASSEVRDVVEAVDVVFVNEREALAMTGERTAEEAASALAERSRHVVVTRGARGATAHVGGAIVDVDAVPVETVVDATGAGDCFAAGYLWAWLRGRPTRVRLEAGNRCGAAAVRRVGGYAGAPTEADLLAAVGS